MIDTSYTLLIESIKECGQAHVAHGDKAFGKALIDTGDVIKNLCEENERLSDTIERLNNSLKDYEDNRVITCKKCRYMQEAKVNKKGLLICPTSGMAISNHDFCSYAERMDEIGSQPRV